MHHNAINLDRLVPIAWPFARGVRRRNLLPRPPVGQLALITALHSVASSISSARTIQEMLSEIVDAAKRFTGTEKVVVCLVDEYAEEITLDESTLVVRGSRGAHAQEWWGEHLGDIAMEVFRDGSPFFEVDRARGSWLLAVPVRAQDKPLGILVAINAVTHRLLAEHTAFLSILGALAAVSIANARLAEEARYAMLASERERIAREMHDGISQSLFSISLGMELCKKQAPKDVTGAIRIMDDLQAQLRQSATELRRLIYDLRPMKLRDKGLAESLRSWVNEATRGSDLKGSALIEGEVVALRPSAESCLYRIGKEAVSNAVRHSGGSCVDLRLSYETDGVLLTVRDDGVGFEEHDGASATRGMGYGLRNMRERVLAEGGRLSIGRAPGGGTVLRAELPTGGK